MSTVSETISPRLREIIEDFSSCEGQAKLKLLLEYAERMPALPDRILKGKNDLDQVDDCTTPVFVHVEADRARKLRFYFDVPTESPTVRGFAAILEDGLRCVTPEQVLSIPEDFYLQMELHQVLSPQRMQGMAAVLRQMKNLASEIAAN